MRLAAALLIALAAVGCKGTNSDRGETAATLRACQMNEVESCAAPATMFGTGVGGPRDEAAALRWTVEACRMGDGRSCQMLIAVDHPEIPVPPQMRQTLIDRTCVDPSTKPACDRLRAM